MYALRLSSTEGDTHSLFSVMNYIMGIDLDLQRPSMASGTSNSSMASLWGAARGGVHDGDEEQHGGARDGEELTTVMRSSTEELAMMMGSNTEELGWRGARNGDREQHEEELE
jgi:hypothetical protein